MANQTPEFSLAKVVANAIDRASFEGWAFAAVFGTKSAALQKRLFLIFIDVLKSHREREEMGLSNNPTHTELGRMSSAMLDEYERRGGMR
jgi:hypothetical protein